MADKITWQALAARIKSTTPAARKYPDMVVAAKAMAAIPELRAMVNTDSLTPSRQAASRSEFERKNPGYLVTANGVETRPGTASSRAINAVLPIAEAPINALKSIPALAGVAAELIGSAATTPNRIITRDGLNLPKTKALVQGIVESVVAPPINAIRNASSGNYDDMASDVGNVIANDLPLIAPGAKMVRSAPSGVRAALQSVGERYPGIAAKANSVAAIDIARALKPVGLESQAVAQYIAPRLAKEGLPAFGIDEEIATRMKSAGKAVRAEQSRITADPRPEADIHIRPALEQIDSAIAKMKRVGGNTLEDGPNVNKQDIQALKHLREDIAALGEYATADDAIDLRQRFDNKAELAGGFKKSSSAADRLMAKTWRGGADLLRTQINKQHPALAAANQRFSLYRQAMDIVERRKLGEVGKADMGLPGRATILDDALATWFGNAVGGPVGGAIAEGVNLATKTRAFAATKSRIAKAIANATTPAEKRAVIRGLLSRGAIPVAATDTSGISVMTGPKSIRGYDDVLLANPTVPKRGPVLPEAPLADDISDFLRPSR